MKRYIVSDRPRLAQTGEYVNIVRKSNRKAVKTWKTVLKEHVKGRTIAVQERAMPLPAELIRWVQSITE